MSHLLNELENQSLELPSENHLQTSDCVDTGRVNWAHSPLRGRDFPAKTTALFLLETVSAFPKSQLFYQREPGPQTPVPGSHSPGLLYFLLGQALDKEDTGLRRILHRAPS